MTHIEGLHWLTGPGAGILAFFAIEWLSHRWSWLSSLPGATMRALSLVATGIIAALGYALLLSATAQPFPPSFWPWVEAFYPVVFAACTTATAAHGVVVLGGKA